MGRTSGGQPPHPLEYLRQDEGGRVRGFCKGPGEAQDLRYAMSQSATRPRDRSMFQEAIERVNISHATWSQWTTGAAWIWARRSLAEMPEMEPEVHSVGPCHQ